MSSVCLNRIKVRIKELAAEARDRALGSRCGVFQHEYEKGRMVALVQSLRILEESEEAGE